MLVKALEMVVEMARKERVVSLPPKGCQYCCQMLSCVELPFRMAAFPDLIAREAILAMTSGRASKIINMTPMGHVNLSSSRPSSSLVLKVILLTVSYNLTEHMHHRISISAVHCGARLLQDPLYDPSAFHFGTSS